MQLGTSRQIQDVTTYLTSSMLSSRELTEKTLVVSYLRPFPDTFKLKTNGILQFISYRLSSRKD